MGTGSLPGVKRPGRGVDHPPASSAEVKERVKVYIYSPMALVECSWVTFTFTFYLYPTNAVVVFSAQLCFAKYCVGKIFAFFLVYFSDIVFAVCMSL
jgi:hypothetical protein